MKVTFEKEAKDFTGRTGRFLSDYWAHLALFSRNARLFLLGSFFMMFGFSIFQLLLNLYLKERSFGENFIGKVLSLAALGSVFAALPAVFMLRLKKVGRTMVAAALLAGAGYSLQAVAAAPLGIFAASLCTGAFVSVYRVFGAPFFMQNSTPKERVFLFSVNFGIGTLAGLIASFSGGHLPDFFGRWLEPVAAYRASLLVGALAVFAAIIPFALIRNNETPGEAPPKPAFAAVRQNIGLLTRLTLPLFVLGLGAGLVIPFLNLYFRSRFNLPTGTLGVYFAWLSVAMLLGVLAGPVLSRRLGMIHTSVWSQLASLPFMIILAFTHHLKLAFVCFLFRGALMNLGQPVYTNFAMERVPVELQPVANGFLMVAWTGSWMVSARAGGALIERFGFEAPLLITAGLYLVSSFLSLAFFRRAEKPFTGQVGSFYEEAV